MTFICSRLDHIPPVPEEFIRSALDPDYGKKLAAFSYFSSTFDQSYLQRSVTVRDQTYHTRYQRKYDLGSDFNHWCRHNLHPDCYHTGVAYNQGIDPYHGPHVDKGRKYVLFYLLQAGGNLVTTTFWTRTGLPTEPTEQQFPSYVCDYDDLEMLDQHVFEPGKWYLFNVGIIHSVENADEFFRISLQASLSVDADLGLVKGQKHLLCKSQ